MKALFTFIAIAATALLSAHPQHESDHDEENQLLLTDQELSREIYNTLSNSWFAKGFQDVMFKVDDGVVTLKGTINSLEDKKKVEDSVKAIEGVKQVNNLIIVAQEEPKTQTDASSAAAAAPATEKPYPKDYAATNKDKLLNAKIRNKLTEKFPAIVNEKITLRTANGIVVITGTVEDFDHIQKINDQLKDIEGISTLKNLVTLKK